MFTTLVFVLAYSFPSPHSFLPSLQEAGACIRELRRPDYHQDVVRIGVEMVLEKKDKERTQLATCLVALHGDGILSSDAIAKGYADVLEFLDDIAIDCPKASGDLGAMLGRVAAAGALGLEFLAHALPPAVDSGRAAELVVALLAEAKSVGGEAKPSELLSNSGLDLLSFLPEASRSQDHLDQLLAAKGISIS